MGRVIWITGLSGAGKTELAVALVERFRRYNKKTILLDGDELRKIFNKKTVTFNNYNKKQRINLGRIYASLSNLLANQGFIVVVATISMFNEIYSWNRENLPGYFEIFLKVPLEELKRRDAKGIYGHYESGLIQDVPGLDINIDEPKNSDWVELYNNGKETSVLAEELIQVLNQDLANEN